MLTVRGVGVDRAAYHRNGPPGRWIGACALLVGCDGSVSDADLRRVLAGREPTTGASLLDFQRSRRRAGWELVLAAPKSVSLVAALAEGEHRRLLEDAHQAGVRAALRYLERHAAFTRREGASVAVHGFVGARFDHRWSAAGDPHLHAHVLVANLAYADGRWSALYGLRLWQHARAADAVYHLTLRAEVARTSPGVTWSVVAGGAADLSGVPRAAIDAVSTRQAQVLADAGDRRSPAAREVARRRTRTLGAAGPWRARAADAGFGPVEAAVAFSAPAVAAGAPTMEAVERELMVFGSRFRPADVVSAVAAHAPAGMDLESLERWVASVCGRSRPGGGGTLVSARGQETDHAVAAAALARGGCGAGVAARPAVPPWPTAAGGQDPLQRLVTAGHGVEVLGPGETPAGRAPILAQSALIDAARSAWQAAGHTVVVVTDSAAAAARWEALTGLVPPDRAGATPTVVVVDRADRMSTPTLGALVGRRGCGRGQGGTG